MASITSCDQKMRKSLTVERRQLMLKDYLKDDLSSCSSNGFKSFPRRQCCTTVRFLLEIDLKAIDSSNNTKRLLRRRSSKAASTTISALQRASEAVINAVKQFPLPSVKSPSVRKGLLSRSFSRKLLKKSFWRKADKEVPEIVRWKSFRDFLEEKDKPSDQNTHFSTTAISSRVSTSTCNDSNSNSWAENEFTADILPSSNGNSESSGENDNVEGKNDLPEKKVSKRVGVTVGEDSIETATTTTTISEESTKEWANEEKEQFSPVSVLDCPFEDDQEDISSPFQCSLARLEGTKQKLMKKIRRFESLAQLEPVDLERRIALSDLENESPESPMQSCSMSIYQNIILGNKEENKTEQKAQELLKLIEMKNPSSSSIFKADNLLLDFFIERIKENNSIERALTGLEEFEHELMKVAEEWIMGQPQELLLGWEVQESRIRYVRDMERNGRWKILDEKEELALELEVEVWTCLVNELLFDLC